MIDDSDAAQRLAQAIMADIRLYNAEAIARGDDISPAIEEGRQLFHSRVAVALHDVYQAALADAGLLAAPAPPSPGVVVPTTGLPPGLFEDPKPVSSTSPGAGARVFVLLLLGLLVAGIAVWFAV